MFDCGATFGIDLGAACELTKRNLLSLHRGRTLYGVQTVAHFPLLLSPARNRDVRTSRAALKRNRWRYRCDPPPTPTYIVGITSICFIVVNPTTNKRVELYGERTI